jgi:hypothetical protein
LKSCRPEPQAPGRHSRNPGLTPSGSSCLADPMAAGLCSPPLVRGPAGSG